MTIDIALIVGFVLCMCLLLCSPRRDEMLWRWLPMWVRRVIYGLTGCYLVQIRYERHRRHSTEGWRPWKIVYEWRRE